MQTPDHGRADSASERTRHLFGARMRAKRVRAGITQAELATRMADEFEIKLDTSGITRIEAGQREPRLNEALAIAEILGLELADASSSESGFEPYLRSFTDQLYESRERLLMMLETVDELTDAVRRSSTDAGTLTELIKEELEGFASQTGSPAGDAENRSPRGVNMARGRADFQLKRRILRTLNDAILSRLCALRLQAENQKEEKQSGTCSTTT